jgi:hypothetical protein
MDNRVIKMNRNTWRIEDAGVRFFLLEDAFDPSADSFTVRRLLRPTL